MAESLGQSAGVPSSPSIAVGARCDRIIATIGSYTPRGFGPRPWLTFLYPFLAIEHGLALAHRCAMKPLFAVLACVALFAASPARADSKVFIIANQPDGYGIDQCLANSERCGAHAAAVYCQARDFDKATAYRRIDPDEVTGSAPKATNVACTHGCNEYIAITCQR